MARRRKDEEFAGAWRIWFADPKNYKKMPRESVTVNGVALGKRGRHLLSAGDLASAGVLETVELKKGGAELELQSNCRKICRDSVMLASQVIAEERGLDYAAAFRTLYRHRDNPEGKYAPGTVLTYSEYVEKIAAGRRMRDLLSGDPQYRASEPEISALRDCAELPLRELSEGQVQIDRPELERRGLVKPLIRRPAVPGGQGQARARAQTQQTQTQAQAAAPSRQRPTPYGRVGGPGYAGPGPSNRQSGGRRRG
ncbi:hypothetical protein [Streptomyces axinellae]